MTHQYSIPTSSHTTHNAHPPQTHLVHAHFYVRGRGPRCLCFCADPHLCDANILQSLVLLRPLSQRSSSARCLYLFRPGITRKEHVEWLAASLVFQEATQRFCLPPEKLDESLPSFHSRHHPEAFLPSVQDLFLGLCRCFSGIIIQVLRFSLTTLYQLPYLRACGTCPPFFCVPRGNVFFKVFPQFLFWLMPSALYVFQ